MTRKYTKDIIEGYVYLEIIKVSMECNIGVANF